MLRNILFFLLCFAIGAGGVWLVLKVKRAPYHASPLQVTGTGPAPAWRGFEVPPGSDVAPFASFNATAVAIEYGDGSKLSAAVKAAHDAHLAVVVLPGNGQGPTFSLKDPYPRPLPEVAAEAQAAGAEALCLSWLNDEPDEEYWMAQVAAVRKAFHGKLILAANDDAAPMVGMWKAVDFMGIAGPVKLPRRLPGAATEYTLEDARHLWAAKLDEWESLSARAERRLVLLNISLPADTGATLPLAGHAAAATSLDCRDTFYAALLTETKGRRHTG